MGQQYQDAVYGSVVLSELQSELLDTNAVQESEHKWQLGLGGLLYRCAESSRLPHIMGAGVLAGKFADALDFTPLEKKTTIASANLHDVGQFGLGHAVDHYFRKCWGIRHEDLSARRIRNDPEILGVLTRQGIDPELVADLVAEENFLSKYHGEWRFAKQLVAGSVDVDRLDFLLRDARSTAPMGFATDYQRLMQCAGRIRDPNYGHIVFYDEKAVPALQAFFSARHSMYQSVYRNPSTRKRDIFLNKALFMMHAYILERFAEHKDDPSRIHGQDMIDALLECNDPRYAIASELIHAVFNRGNSIQVAYLRQGHKEDEARLKVIMRNFVSAEALEKHLLALVGAKEGDVIVSLDEGERTLNVDDVFIQTNYSGFEQQKIVLATEGFLHLESFAPYYRENRSLQVFTIRGEHEKKLLDELLRLAG